VSTSGYVGKFRFADVERVRSRRIAELRPACLPSSKATFIRAGPRRSRATFRSRRRRKKCDDGPRLEGFGSPRLLLTHSQRRRRRSARLDQLTPVILPLSEILKQSRDMCSICVLPEVTRVGDQLRTHGSDDARNRNRSNRCAAWICYRRTALPKKTLAWR